jgi:hypothetical protein
MKKRTPAGSAARVRALPLEVLAQIKGGSDAPAAVPHGAGDADRASLAFDPGRSHR